MNDHVIWFGYTLNTTTNGDMCDKMRFDIHGVPFVCFIYKYEFWGSIVWTVSEIKGEWGKGQRAQVRQTCYSPLQRRFYTEADPVTRPTGFASPQLYTQWQCRIAGN
ncbi:hypothetical protein WN51_11903 [Melipona quadrifasciata]|uniref:Uncharacterized protein n=1 Tax=Melipona quadrifasciata TaxID=166423 RepID=A0A0M9A562_9HYME|nr:hypothetical protein WN51_11903 [Melipona quadrifasciata]